MKRNIILGCLCAALSFSACDNYLDVVPKGKAVLNSTSDYLGLIESINTHWSADRFGYMSNEITSPYRNNLESYLSPLVSAAYFWDENLDRTQYMDTSGEGLLYNDCYKRISNYNILIENIGDAEGPKSDKILGIAQAKILRAYNYFFLINTFAKPYNPITATTDRGIILHTEFNLEKEGIQSSIADAYKLIQQDIDEAINDLPEEALNSYRPDRAFGYALKAKVHLFKREIGDALKAALEVTKFRKHELWNMVDWYKTDREAFEKANAGNPMYDLDGPMASMAWSNFHMNYLKHKFSDPENLYYQSYLSVFSVCILTKATLDLYDANNDVRYKSCFAFYMPARPSAEPGTISFMNGMQIQLNETGIRLSEVYLMIAECYAREGNIDLALQYLNDLRKLRIMNYTNLTKEDVNNDKEKALQFVREERKRELAMSYNGFFDMRRFCTEFNETLTKTYVNSKGETQTFTLKPDSHLLTFPFPIAAMQTSNLIQNSK